MKKRKTLNQEEVSSFCSQLSLLLPAGITPYEAITLICEDTPDARGKDILEQLTASLKEGLSFYEALQNTSLFPEYVLAMVLLGEESGNLDIIIQKLADYYEQQCSITASIKNAIRYPIVMICFMLIILVVLLTKLLPIFNLLFLQLGSELTGVAAQLMAIGSLIKSFSGFLILLTILFAITFIILSYVPTLRRRWVHFIHTNRLTRNFFLDIAYARFASAMSMTTASGMDLFRSLSLAKMLVGNEIAAQKIDQCAEAISSGDYLYEAMKKAGIFHSTHLRMLQLGQRSGETDAVLAKISAYYENEALTRLQRMLGAIEPTLVIFFSLLVGLILLSVMMPLIGIMSSIG